MTDISYAIFGKVLLDMNSDKYKTSVDELQNQIDMYKYGSKKRRNVTKSEQNPNIMLIPPETGEKIILSIFQKGKGHIDHVLKELDVQGVKLLMTLEDMK